MKNLKELITNTIKLVQLIILTTLVISCSKDDNIRNEPPIETGLLENQTITISGLSRGYHLYVPQNYINAPIVFLFHGNRSSNDLILGLGINGTIKAPYKIWLTIATQENVILVVPKGINNGWNDCRSDANGNPNSNDVEFTNELIDFVADIYQANASKVFAVGTSNGGHMVMRLAQEIPDKLNAFAAIVAANPINSQCANSTVPISALFMNGTEDLILPDEGGAMAEERGEVFSAQETIEYWVDRNETDMTPIVTDLLDTNIEDNSTVKKHLYINGTNNTEVAFYQIIGGGHTEPSISERYTNLFLETANLGNQNGDIEMATEVWEFFKNK